MTAFLKHDRYAEWPGVSCRSSARPPFPGPAVRSAGVLKGPSPYLSRRWPGPPLETVQEDVNAR